MDKAKLIDLIKTNPNALVYIPNPSDELKLLAVQKNGLALKHIEHPHPGDAGAGPGQ